MVLGIVTAQALLGIIAGIIKLFRNGSTFGIYFFAACHKYLGYILLLLTKIQTYLIVDVDGDHPVLWRIMLTVECILFGCYIAIKFCFPTMASRIMPEYEENKYRPVQSVKELQKGEN